MRKEINPSFVPAIMIAVVVLILAVLPVRIQIVQNQVSAQETQVVESPVAVAQAEAQVVEYTLRTIMGQTPPMAYIGVGGGIDGQINPTLTANVGDTVRITIVNGDPVLHNLHIVEFGVASADLVALEEQDTVEFVVDKPGDFVYFCEVPGHRQVGMFGTLTVSGEAPAETAMSGMSTMNATPMPTVSPAIADAVSVVLDPTDLPGPIGDRGPTNVRVDLNAVEVNGVLADGATFRYFTFNGTLPGPMIRVRVGDTVDMHIFNDTTSQLQHSIDLHAVTGPGGGAVYTQTNPGEETSFTFQALAPGVYVYHCATPSVAHHIANGMFGLIVVEPPGGLPPVDREFYVMQNEIYTAEPYGTQGNLTFSHEAMLDEQPEYFVFNGAAGALMSDEHALRANVGETIRIFFGVGGPNFISSFHVIGEIMDRVANLGSLTSPMITDVQTTVVPPGGATMVELHLEVPGRYILVDHALSRMERGLAGYLYVEGEENPAIFHSEGVASSAGH